MIGACVLVCCAGGLPCPFVTLLLSFPPSCYCRCSLGICRCLMHFLMFDPSPALSSLCETVFWAVRVSVVREVSLYWTVFESGDVRCTGAGFRKRLNQKCWQRMNLYEMFKGSPDSTILCVLQALIKVVRTGKCHDFVMCFTKVIEQLGHSPTGILASKWGHEGLTTMVDPT